MSAQSKTLRFAIFGAGFWVRYQLAGWRELDGAECVAIYNRTRAKAEALARELGIPAVYDEAEELLREVKPDFVDNITEVGGHKPLSLLCAKHRTPCVCQKPMAAALTDARQMVAAFRRTKTPFFANQPALRDRNQFILADLGVHVLDVARAFFGEANSVYCLCARTLAPDVKGENVATLVLSMGPAKTTVLVELGYAKTPLEPSVRECFPQTLAFVEGPKGSIELCADYVIRVTTAQGTQITRHPPPRYAWANPAYEIAHASIVPCNANLLAALQGKRRAETTGEDNLKTVELVFAAYESARTRNAVCL